MPQLKQQHDDNGLAVSEIVDHGEWARDLSYDSSWMDKVEVGDLSWSSDEDSYDDPCMEEDSDDEGDYTDFYDQDGNDVRGEAIDYAKVESELRDEVKSKQGLMYDRQTVFLARMQSGLNRVVRYKRLLVVAFSDFFSAYRQSLSEGHDRQADPRRCEQRLWRLLRSRPRHQGGRRGGVSGTIPRSQGRPLPAARQVWIWSQWAIHLID